MNPLNSIRKHLVGLEASYVGIKTDTTRAKAKDMILESCSRMGMGFLPLVVGETVTALSQNEIQVTETVDSGTTVSLSVDCSVGETGILSPVVGESAPKAVETPVLPVVVGGAEVGSPPVVVTERVELVGGWPITGEIEVVGLAPNRRTLKGKLGDGRTVSMERSLKPWKVGEVVRAKLIRAGTYPLYRVAD